MNRKVEPEQALQHLEEVLSSTSFASSKRCQDFLRYVVVEALEGRGSLIKERNIAHDVFGKGASFEPNEDALVRVKAREVRKRLMEFYESAARNHVRIDLPVGAYIPHIYSLDKQEAHLSGEGTEKTSQAHRVTRRKLSWMLGASAAALGLVSLVPLVRHEDTPLDRFWRPVFKTRDALLIFIPVLDSPDGKLSVDIGVGPAAALRQASDFLTQHNYPYHLRFGPDLTFPQMIEHPTLLLGGFASVWAMRITQKLRFTLTWDESNKKVILDRSTGKIWRPLNETQHGFADQDYGILCRLFDPASGQIVIIAAGILTFGTVGAADLLFKQDLFNELLKMAPADWETKNFEAIIQVSIIGMVTSTPQLVAAHFW